MDFLGILTTMNVGKRLRKLRESKGLSQGDIERRIGRLRSYLSRVESSHTAPSLSTLEKLTKALEVEPYQLVFEERNSPKKIGRRVITSPFPSTSRIARVLGLSKESNLEAAVERQLRKARLKYVKEPVVGNTRPDFLVTTEHGDQIVVEVKAWERTPETTARASHQVQRYKELSGAAAALIVTATGAFLPLPAGAVVPVAGLMTALAELAGKLEKETRFPKALKYHASPKKWVFASMPFSDQYDDTFLVAIRPATLAVSAKRADAERIDHTGGPGDVVQQIKGMINGAEAVVADLSDSRANVCHEVGYAEALGKPVVQICSTPIASLPFNLRNNRTISYSIGQASRLRTKLEKELGKVL